jgi:hypothetical protein
MGYGFDRAEISRGYSVEKVEEYTLQDLGGLDATISGAGDGVGPPEPDFVWFGITERMKVSLAIDGYPFGRRQQCVRIHVAQFRIGNFSLLSFRCRSPPRYFIINSE